MTETTDAISMVETIIDAHPLHSIIIGGDLNTELKGASPFDPLWRDLTLKYNLSCCDQFISGNNNYTYNHESLGHRKWKAHEDVYLFHVLASKISLYDDVVEEVSRVSHNCFPLYDRNAEYSIRVWKR